MIANATIVRLRWPTLATDAHGDPPAEADAVATTLAREGEASDWAIAPSLAESITDRGRQGVVDGLTLLGPEDGDLDPARDRVEVNGDRYRIVGEVGRWKSPLSGWAAGLAVEMRRGEG